MFQLWYFLPPLAAEFGLSWFSRSAINSRTRVLSCLCHGAGIIYDLFGQAAQAARAREKEGHGMSDDKDLEIETKMMAALLANPAVVDKPGRSFWNDIANMAIGAAASLRAMYALEERKQREQGVGITTRGSKRADP